MNNVAVYGSLRKGFGNHVLLNKETTTFKGTTKTPPEYTMKSLGGFPGVFLEGHSAITLEVYEVDDLIFKRLDSLEGYPRFYNRKEIDTEFGKAWMYFLEQDHRNLPVVESGDWSKHNDII